MARKCDDLKAANLHWTPEEQLAIIEAKGREIGIDVRGTIVQQVCGSLGTHELGLIATTSAFNAGAHGS